MVEIVSRGKRSGATASCRPPTPFSGACGRRSGSCRGCPDVQHCVQIGREETEASGQGAHLGGRLESIEREAEGGGQ